LKADWVKYRLVMPLKG